MLFLTGRWYKATITSWGILSGQLWIIWVNQVLAAGIIPGDVPGEHWESDLFPWHGAYCGDIDLTGWRKPISHYRSMLYNNTEKLYMAVREPESRCRKN
jgi:hypothetical protein